MFCVLYSNSSTIAAIGAIRRMHSPNGGIQWLWVKPWMCSIGRCTPRHTTALPWPSTLLSICLHFLSRRFVVGHNYAKDHVMVNIKYIWVTNKCGVNMMSLRHSWGGWEPTTQTASCIHIRHMKCLSTLTCFLQTYMSSCTQLNPPYLAQIMVMGFCVTCGLWSQNDVITSWLWLTGQQPPQTDIPIHLGHFQSFWAYWYAVHKHCCCPCCCCSL